MLGGRAVMERGRMCRSQRPLKEGFIDTRASRCEVLDGGDGQPALFGREEVPDATATGTGEQSQFSFADLPTSPQEVPHLLGLRAAVPVGFRHGLRLTLRSGGGPGVRSEGERWVLLLAVTPRRTRRPGQGGRRAVPARATAGRPPRPADRAGLTASLRWGKGSRSASPGR